ncbi:MAG: hypothetical protein HY351_04855 [Candidatus Omnitrophica bacterium]|nr:hypothetical protein [Candidatus Omnitrophota bacterium]
MQPNLKRFLEWLAIVILLMLLVMWFNNRHLKKEISKPLDTPSTTTESSLPMLPQNMIYQTNIPELALPPTELGMLPTALQPVEEDPSEKNSQQEPPLL